MSFAVSSSKLTGIPGPSGWVQVHEYLPKDEEKLKLRGHLFAVIATSEKGVSGPNLRFRESQGSEKGPRPGGGVESVAAGRELLTRLHEEYFGSTEASAFKALSDACKKVIDEFRRSWGEVQIAAVSILDDVVYTACGGGGQTAIFRDRMLASLLVSKNNDVVSASGYPKENDILIIGTSSFFEEFTDGTLKAALSGKDVEKAAESLAPTIHSSSSRGDTGAAFLKFQKSKPIEKEEEIVKMKKEEVRQERKIEFGRKRWSPAGLASFAGKLRSRALSFAAVLPDREIYVKKAKDDVDTAQNRKVAVSIGFVLLVLLAVSIGFGIRQKGINDEKSRYEDRLTSAIHLYDEAVSLFELDTNRARELFAESFQIADQLKREEVSDPRLDELSTNLEGSYGQILGEFTVSAELFVDLPLVSDGFRGDSLAVTTEIIYVLDIEGEKIMKTAIETKGSKIIAGPDIAYDAKNIAAYSDRVYIAKKDGIFEATDDEEQVVEDTMGDNNLVHGYAANLYVLNRDTSKIFRYTAAGEGFSSGNNWLIEGIEPDFSKIISWTIDGAIWLLSDTGKIFKYSQGNPQAFTVSGVVPSLINPKAIYTNEELTYIYLLEPDAQRIVIIDKEGSYIAQYKSEQVEHAISLAVSEKERKIILLTPDKLFSIELEHLQ